MPKHLFFHHAGNNLLATLSDPDRDLIEAHLRPIQLARGRRLEDPGQIIETVYFPISGIGSTVTIGRRGRRIETGIFGREGMSGNAVVMAADRSPNETVMQMAGHGLAIEAGRLRKLFDQAPSMRHHFLRYAQALSTQTAHTALSNGQTKVEERLARRLLMCHDRLDGNDMELTHEALALTLGVRRAGITVGMHMLEAKGHIRAVRKRITVVDRDGLEAEVHQSYGVPEAEYERLIG